MSHPSEKFNEVLQLLSPLCITSDNMDIVRMVKDLQEYTEYLEEHADKLTAIIKNHLDK